MKARGLPDLRSIEALEEGGIQPVAVDLERNTLRAASGPEDKPLARALDLGAINRPIVLPGQPRRARSPPPPGRTRGHGPRLHIRRGKGTYPGGVEKIARVHLKARKQLRR